jgi:hypothetical protein
MPFLRLKNIVLLFKKQLLEQRKFYGLSLLALFVALCVINMLFYYFSHDVSENRFEMFSVIVCNFGFLIAATFVTAGSFYETHNHKSSITYLQLPVTNTERVLVNLLFAFILMPLLILGVVYGTDWLFTTVHNARHLPRYHMPHLKPGLHFAPPFTRTDFTLLFLVLNGIYFAGAAWFKKLNWVLTTVTGVLFIVMLVFVNIIPAMGNKPVGVLPMILSLSNFVISNGEAGLDTDFPAAGYTFLRAMRAFLWCMPLILSAAAYFRLKEKQV